MLGKLEKNFEIICVYIEKIFSTLDTAGRSFSFEHTSILLTCSPLLPSP